jgi:SAM-dependent methyltransferase
MMFGSHEEFPYDQCAACGSIQIAEILKDGELGRHYPSDYYALSAEQGKKKGVRSAVKAYLTAERDRGVFGKSLVGQLIGTIKPETTPIWVIHKAGVRQDQKILDVGCGKGVFLDRLARLGFRNVSGSDPFLNADMVTSEGVHLRKLRLADLDGSFDVITFNHSFEHVPDPQADLRSAREKLGPNGLCLIQMPTPSSDAWEEYGTDWAQWDAPRHLTLMTRKGVSILAANCGFDVREIIDIGDRWSLMSSELNRRGILIGWGEQYNRHFTRWDQAAFRRKAISANAAGRGDSISCVLVKR